MKHFDLFGLEQSSPVKITKPVRLIELFAGIGSQAMSLRQLGVDFEHYKVVEFDKCAIDSYNAIHGTGFTTTDIRDITIKDLEIVDKDKYSYILTYSFPCVDLSNDGKKLGMGRESGTRSGLLWEVERLLSEAGGGAMSRGRASRYTGNGKCPAGSRCWEY